MLTNSEEVKAYIWCIRKVKELDEVKHLPMDVVKKIDELVQVLDNEYGSERDVGRDLGRYVGRYVVVGRARDIK